MTNTQDENPAKAPAPWSARLALLIAILALAGVASQWLGATQTAERERSRSEDLARAQRRINGLEERLQREQDEYDRFAAKVGVDGRSQDTVTARIARLEESTARMPGSDRARFLWVLDQAEYFLRVANAQENLAGDPSSALAALAIADDLLGKASDPRFAPVRKVIAGEMAALRGVPHVDTEGLALKLGTLGASLRSLPRKQGAPPAFRPEPPPAPAATGMERASQALRNAFYSIVSVRRTSDPPATLLSDESAEIMVHSLELELQMARLALLRGDSAGYRDSLGAVRRGLAEYYDVDAPPVVAAIASVDELTTAPLPKSLPDVSGSLAELLKVREAHGGQGVERG